MKILFSAVMVFLFGCASGPPPPAWQASARYRVPLPARGTLTRELTAGVDFKRSNNNLSFGGSQVFAQENDVVQATLAFSVNRPDKYGTMAGSLTLALSPGGLSRNMTSPNVITFIFFVLFKSRCSCVQR